jgi:hypothetical protein
VGVDGAGDVAPALHPADQRLSGVQALQAAAHQVLVAAQHPHLAGVRTGHLHTDAVRAVVGDAGGLEQLQVRAVDAGTGAPADAQAQSPDHLLGGLHLDRAQQCLHLGGRVGRLDRLAGITTPWLGACSGLR